MNVHLKKSLADIRHYRGRTLLVVIAIFIGVLGITGISMTEHTLLAALEFSLGGQNSQPDIVMAVDRLQPELQSQLQELPNVKTVQYEKDFTKLWHVQRAPGYLQIKIISYPDLQHVNLGAFELVSGRYPQAADEIMMEYGDKGLENINLGDTLTIDTAQAQMRLHVVGFARTPGSDPAVTEKVQAYMSQAAINQLNAFTTLDQPNRPTRLQLVNVKVDTLNHTQAVARALAQTLQAHGVRVLMTGTPSANALSWDEYAGVFTLSILLVILAIAISTILLFNTITMMVTEQITIIGTMKVLGGTRGRIMLGYLLTVGIYSLLALVPGIVLGLFAGFFLASAVAATIPIATGSFDVAPEIIAPGLLAGLIVPLLAAIPPVWNGTRITVRAALSAYGVHTSERRAGTLRRRLANLSWPSQTSWLGLRSLFRRTWRVLLVLLTLTVAGVSFLVVQTLTTSVNDAVDSTYAKLAADIEVDAENASFQQLQQQLGALPNVARVERYRLIGANTFWGHISVWGFEPGTRLYHYQLTSGRWLRPGDSNVVLLSDSLAQRSGLSVGQVLSATGTQGLAANWTVIGTVQQASNSFGEVGAVILPEATVAEFQGVPPGAVNDEVSRILLEVRDHSPQALDQLTNRIGALALSSNTGKSSGIVNVLRMQDEVLRHQKSWYGVYGLLYGVAAIIGIAGILALANELATSVLERRREIGILRVLGASSRNIAQVFWVQGLALGALAWASGAIIGIPLSYVFLRLFSQLVLPASFVASPLAFVIMLFAILLIATLASIAPALRAARLRVATMLRYE